MKGSDQVTMVPWNCLLFLAHSCNENHGSGAKDGAQQQRQRQHRRRHLDIIGHSLLACAKASMVAAQMTLHDNDGGRAKMVP
jgi:hypothetical protein